MDFLSPGKVGLNRLAEKMPSSLVYKPLRGLAVGRGMTDDRALSFLLTEDLAQLPLIEEVANQAH